MSAPGNVWRVEQSRGLLGWDIYEEGQLHRVASYTRETDARAVVDANNAKGEATSLTAFPAERLAEIKANAKAATPGPWHLTRCDDGRLMVHTVGDTICFSDPNHREPCDEKTMRHLAGLDRDTVLSMVAEIRSLARRLGEAEHKVAGLAANRAQRSGLSGEIQALFGANERLTAAEVKQLTGAPAKQVFNALAGLVRRGKLRHEGYGRYRTLSKESVIETETALRPAPANEVTRP